MTATKRKAAPNAKRASFLAADEFDPAWSLEQAQAADDRAGEGLNRTSAVFRHDAVQRIAECERQFAEGDRFALLWAIYYCALRDLPMPEWVAVGYLRAFRDYTHLRAKTLDDAFGVARRKGVHLAAQRKRQDLMFAVHRDVVALVNHGSPINKQLFIEVGKRHALGKTTCEKYYRDACKTTERTMTPTVRALLDPLVAPAVRRERATRKVSKFRGSRSGK